jgi:AcrR family transcriptional regulator
MARRDENAENSRRALLDAARRVFAKKGYADASLEDIVGPARLTKGALYHHFKNKAALLEAVYVEMSEHVAAAVTEAVTAIEGDAWDRLLAALDAFFDASAEPEYVRIVLRDAPVVLGLRHGRDLDLAIGQDLVRALLADLLAEGMLPPSLPLDAAARVLLAAVSEVAIDMAYADDPRRARQEGAAVIVALLEGLRARATAPRRGR